MGPDLVRRPAPQTFETKGDAEGWLGRRRGDVMAGEWQPPVKVPKVAPLTFDAYSAQWLRERDLKPRTREGYEHLMRSYLSPVLGPQIIDTITPSVVRTRWSQLPADKPTVRARSYALLKAVMNTAVADEVVDSNPCRIRGAANTPRAREIRPASIDELAVIVEAIPTRRMAREAAGRPDLRVHDLRHTGATMAAQAGATLAELQQRLGHSSVSAALRYQHAAQGRTLGDGRPREQLARDGSVPDHLAAGREVSSGGPRQERECT